MNPKSKWNGKSRRGVIGIESAIVMIAFVIVAAALAFVVLNMGFSTTQKAKTAIASSITEASSSLEIAGKVSGVGYIAQGKLNATAVPLKIAGGGGAVNLDPLTTSIRYFSNSVSYDNIYGPSCIDISTTYGNLTQALNASKNTGCIDQNPAGPSAAAPNSTKGIIYWAVTRYPENAILDQGESAVLAIAYKTTDRPGALDKIGVEIIVPTGAALTVERNVPSITTDVVDLG